MISDARALEVLRVHKGDVFVGVLRRTPHGASFAYLPEYVSQGDTPQRRIAFGMPVRQVPCEVRGVNLHPYFAGLLPEGLRLAALIKRTKTSPDDRFTLLAAAGGDAIGDVWASAADGAQNAPTDSAQEPAIELDPRNLGSVRFRDILERQLDSGEPVAVPGALPKVSAARLTIPVREGTPGRHYILKLSTPEMPRLVENECFFMRAARAVGIQTARVKRVKDAVREADLVVERFDRRPFQASNLARLTSKLGCHREQLPSIGFATKQTRDLERTLVERIGHLSAQAG